MAVQTTYNESIAGARAGQVINTEHAEFVSRMVETAAGVPFGVPVQQGANDKGCAVMAAGATAVVGIAVRERSVNPATPNAFAQYEEARLMRKGVIWVTVTDAGGVAPGDEVWVALADGTFSNADLGTSGSIQLPGCRWETTAANGALAQLRVNLDVPAVAGAI